jgi:hypothetical protein
MRVVSLTALLTAFALGAAAVAAEVKSTTRITILAEGVPVVEVRDPLVLSLSHVFAGGFIGEPAPAPDPALPRYTVTFEIQQRDDKIKVRGYEVTYCRNLATGEAFVFLPGSGDAYRRNIGTIIRDGQDGRWHRASDQWSAALNAYVR